MLLIRANKVVCFLRGFVAREREELDIPKLVVMLDFHDDFLLMIDNNT